MTITIPDPITPTETDVEVSRRSSRQLSRLYKPGRSLKLTPQNGGKSEKPPECIEIPEAAVRLLQQLLTEMAAGNAVTIIPIHAELTTQQAADLLGASRPFVVKLIDSGGLKFRKVGTHRRIMFADLMAYKKAIDGNRRKTLDELAAEAQALDPEY